MRAFVTTVVAVLLASAVQVDRISILPLAAQDRVAGVLAEVKKALGGADKVAALKGLTAEGPFRRSMGGREMEGVLSLTIERPDRMRRVEDMAMGGMVGGPTFERTSVLAGNIAWDDTANRGGMGGGMRIEMRSGPGPGAGGAAGQDLRGPGRRRRRREQLRRQVPGLDGWSGGGSGRLPGAADDRPEGRELRLRQGDPAS